VQDLCLGLASGEPERFPVKTRKLKRSAQSLALLWAERADGAIWLERRPATGIWGGLYCFPVFAGEDDLLAALPAALQGRLQAVPPFVHVLTHKDLRLSPMRLLLPEKPARAPRLPGDGAWFGREDWTGLGLPAPIRKLLG